MNRCHKMSVTSKYFSMLKSGQKRVEFRILDDKRRLIRSGDFIEFFCHSDSVEPIQFQVKDIVESSDFKTLINALPDSLFDGISKQNQLQDLEKIYQLKLSNNAVLAILLE